MSSVHACTIGAPARRRYRVNVRARNHSRVRQRRIVKIACEFPRRRDRTEQTFRVHQAQVQRKITDISFDKKSGVTTVELKSDVPRLSQLSGLGREIKLLVHGDVSRALQAVLVLPGKEEEARAEGYAALSAHFFTGPLADLSDTTKQALLRFADLVANGTTIGSTVFKEKLFLVVDLGTDENVYNELKLNQSQRVAEVMNERLLAILKAFAKQIEGNSKLYGLKLELSIPHKSFANEFAAATYDKLEVYVGSEDTRKFADADITSQQLMDSAVVIVNSNRIQVPLNQ